MLIKGVNRNASKAQNQQINELATEGERQTDRKLLFDAPPIY